MIFNFRKMINDHRGSSSVLVMMVMLMLISFAVLAMLSSYSHYKIASKNASWTKDYYRLESLANEHYAIVKSLVADAAGHGFKEAFVAGLSEKNSEAFHWSLEEDAENDRFYVTIDSKDVTSGRQFEAKLSIVLTEPQHPQVRVIKWQEIPSAFDYDSGLLFVDPEE